MLGEVSRCRRRKEGGDSAGLQAALDRLCTYIHSISQLEHGEQLVQVAAIRHQHAHHLAGRVVMSAVTQE